LAAEKILLVEQGRIRWSLPGGASRRDESPPDAAPRELSEETTLNGCEPGYIFRVAGLNKRHHVFFSVLADDARPDPSRDAAGFVLGKWARW